MQESIRLGYLWYSMASDSVSTIWSLEMMQPMLATLSLRSCHLNFWTITARVPEKFSKGNENHHEMNPTYGQHTLLRTFYLVCIKLASRSFKLTNPMKQENWHTRHQYTTKPNGKHDFLKFQYGHWIQLPSSRIWRAMPISCYWSICFFLKKPNLHAKMYILRFK